MSDAFPKLLVATEFPPNASGGGPAVVRQMLQDWPADRLIWWSCLPERDPRFGRTVAAHRLAEIPARLLPQVRLARFKAWALERFWSPWAQRRFRAALRELRPEVVWVIPHEWSIFPLAATLPGGQIGFHVTVQDYANARSQQRRFGLARSERLAAAAGRLYAAATTRDATSHPMIEDLRARTGKDAAQMLHAGLEPSDFAFLNQKQAAPGPKIRLAHAGTIVVEEVFEIFVAALQKIRGELPRPLTLELFGAHRYADRPWFDATWMQQHGNFPEAELLAQLRTCDWGVSPMALTEDNPRYNRFSYPTKFITYLAAGLPVITLGQAESSVVKMARSYAVGPCSPATTATELAPVLRAALSKPAPWERHRAEILRCARTEFDAARMREKLTGCFRQGAARTAAL